MGSRQCKAAKADVDEINETTIRRNPLVQAMEKKHHEEIGSKARRIRRTHGSSSGETAPEPYRCSQVAVRSGSLGTSSSGRTTQGCRDEAYEG
ncbi:hypothetical protein D9757_013649 [Collybiopsis confluens]|uniref:Uncharacterized protein n=1 Tax=Collybiopsis confluens TaxID=2823264 RepID=A0A8H5CU61_9AGAR|nr:hypothetical protein D9757_013649 [Collybiopsis confluens]